MKLNLVSFHGLYSQGDNLEILVNGLEAEAEKRGIDVVTSQHDYPRLNATMGVRRWARNIVKDYILKCLSLEFYKFPDRLLYVLLHSNATWGGSRAIQDYYWDWNGYGHTHEKIRIDRLFLFGSTIRRDFDWSMYPDIDVVNFVGTKDRVVWFSKLYGMGWSGRKGFKEKSPNLTQHYNKWRHSDFVLPENFDFIKDEVFK
jgi:hypothetical protein